MASEGWNNPATAVDDATIGTRAWTNPTNVFASDDTDAIAGGPIANPTHYLKATNFSFSIPGDATINGIIVEVERASTSGDINKDESIRIVKGNTIQGDEKKDTVNFWPTSDTYNSYGNATDLWGLTWTPANINASDFGVVVAVDSPHQSGVQIDHIRITVHYTEIPATNMEVNIGDVWKTITALQLNINNVWKTVTGAQVNIGDTWKTVF